VGALTWAEIRRLQLRTGPEAEPIDQPPPTLGELLTLVNRRVRLLIEIKHPEQGQYVGLEEKILALLEAHRMVEKTLVISFDIDDLTRLRQLHPTVRLGGLLSARQVSEGRSIATLLEEVVAARAQLAGLQHTLLTADVIAAARRRGLDETVMQRMLELGIDILISDRPDLAKRLVTAGDP
jgi:glycerophosphoryl diester phosphodiesterase